MKITVKRGEEFVEYEVQTKEITLLELLKEIKTTQDNTLTFSSGCRSSVCGSCSMRVNDLMQKRKLGRKLSVKVLK